MDAQPTAAPQTQTQQAQSAPASAPSPSAPSSAPSTPSTQYKPPKPKANLLPIILALVVVVVIAVVGVAYTKGYILKPTTTIATTTVVASNVSTLSGCYNITSPGKYFISYPLKTAIVSGACIEVLASNVSIVCNTNKLTGSGPFNGTPPFTYGIEIDDQNNVNINSCGVRNFSYGIFALSSSNVSITGSNLSVNYMSDLYLNNTHDSQIENNYLSKASSTQGALYLANGTSGITVQNNTIEYNQYYGVVVNSTNNTYQDNYVNSTPVSFYCGVPDSYVIGSTASHNICYNNTGCGFLECRASNIPSNISKVILPYDINSCGTIATPGAYNLYSNLNMANYVNVSNFLSLANPCINIATSDVQINCNGHTITNSTTGIFAQNVNNVIIENCNIKNAKTGGLLLYSTSYFHITNDNFTDDNNGVGLYNSLIDIFSNVTTDHNDYGITVSGSYSNNFQSVNSENNSYGVYLQNNSLSNSFSKGIIENNSKFDVYATADSANSTLNLMQGTICGDTDAAWATCSHFVAALLPYIPVRGCATLSAPGNYLLMDSLFNIPASCIKIDSSNVALGCDNRTLTSVVFAPGVGITVTNDDNVSIDNCTVVGFNGAVNVTSSSGVSLNHVNVQRSLYGITFQRVSYGTISNSSLNGTRNTSVALYNTTWTDVQYNNVTYGLSRNIAFTLNSSSDNKLMNNSASTDYIGYAITERSLNNTIQNNTAQSSTHSDFVCSTPAHWVNSENGGINYATTKVNCLWLAAITKINPALSCAAASQPGLFDIAQDAVYTIGSTCFSAYNLTTINCNGHTIISTSNGTFASFVNAKRSTIENCNLKGFAVPIMSSNTSLTISNVSIFDSYPKASAIVVQNSPLDVNIHNSNVTTSYVGLNLSNVAIASIENNYVSNSSAGYDFYNVSSSTISNNTAALNDYNGIVLNFSQFNDFKDNSFSGSNTGLQCVSGSQGGTNNTDEGQNSCNSNSNCFWIKASSSICG